MATPINTNFSQYTDVPFDVPEETFDDDEMVYGEDIYVISGSEDLSTDDGENNFDDIIQSLNQNNMSFVKEDEQKHFEAQQKKKEEDKKIHEQRVHEIHKGISEEEQIGREQKEREEAEALLLEQEQQRQSSLFSKLGGIRKKKEKHETQNKPIENKPIENKTDEIKKDVISENTFEESQKTVSEIKSEKQEPEKQEPEKQNEEKKEKKSFFSKFLKETLPKKEVSKNTENKEELKDEPKDGSNDTFKSEEEEWKYLATHDGLTKLKNLKAYEFDTKTMEAKNIAIIFLDVNNLKYVNDNFGHESGNKLLLATSSAINKVFPDIGYRIGGDEFLVVYQKPKAKEDKIREYIDNKIKEFQKELKRIAKEDEEGIPYAVSVGYDIGNGKKSIDDIKNEADKKMYEVKKQYKKEHPDFDVRHEFKKDKKEQEEPPKDYDTLLSKEQQELKGVIKQNHRQALEETTEKIMMEIQRRNQEILAIMIASPTFDHLFIIQDVGTFIGLVNEMDSLIDYSYLYVVYEGGPQYYGTDEYYNEVTHIFEAVSNGLRSGRMLTNKDIQKIKGINIFKEIYIE